MACIRTESDSHSCCVLYGTLTLLLLDGQFWTRLSDLGWEFHGFAYHHQSDEGVASHRWSEPPLYAELYCYSTVRVLTLEIAARAALIAESAPVTGWYSGCRTYYPWVSHC